MTDTETTLAGWPDMLVGRYAVFSAILGGGIVLHAGNSFITATMLPSIVSEIGGIEYYAWNTTLFVVAAILSAAVTGRVLRHSGTRVAFAIAGTVFIVGSALAAIAPSMPVMLAGRTVQGAGGGMIFTLCYSMIIFVYPESLWPRAMALLSGTWGIATLIGPAVGGAFAEFDMWRMGFGILVPVTALYVVVALMLLPGDRHGDAENGRVPFGQLLLLAAAVLAISIGGATTDLAWNIAGVLVTSGLGWWLVRREHDDQSRLFPRGTFSPGTPLFLAFAAMALLIFTVNVDFFMPYYLQRLHGMSPLIAGYIAAIVAIGWSVAEVLAARYSGAAMRRIVVAGPVIVTAALLLLAITTPLKDQTGPLLIAVMTVGLFAVGAGIGMGWPHLSTFVLQYTPQDERENAASALSTMQMFAIAFGTAVAGLVGNLSGFNGDDSGVARAAFMMAAVFFLAALLSVVVARNLVRKLTEAAEAPATGS